MAHASVASDAPNHARRDHTRSAMASLRAIASPTLGLSAAPTDALGRHALQVRGKPRSRADSSPLAHAEDLGDPNDAMSAVGTWVVPRKELPGRSIDNH